MRVKGLHPLQKHWVSPRLKMARSGQGRRRLKTALPFRKAGEKPPLPSAKIRSRYWSHQIFSATVVGFLIVGTIYSLSSATNMAPACQESELMRGLGILASSSPPPLVPSFASASSSLPSLGTSWCFYFFFFCLFHHRIHPGAFTSSSSSPLPSKGVTLLYIIATGVEFGQICRFLVPFQFCFCNQRPVQACLSPSLYAVLLLYINKS